MGETLADPRFSARGDSNYDPCVVGLHICGCAMAPSTDFEQPYTAFNIEASSHAVARAMFEAGRAEAECAKDEHDFVCDLNLGSAESGVEHVDDFYTNRQLFPRLVAAARAAASGDGP